MTTFPGGAPPSAVIRQAADDLLSAEPTILTGASLSFDHGLPSIDGAKVWFCSDEHTTFSTEIGTRPAVGDLIRVLSAHVDPTVTLHGRRRTGDRAMAGRHARLAVTAVPPRGGLRRR
jgi:D-serine deaminase-like pyridoxal phosphate-dependent protein